MCALLSVRSLRFAQHAEVMPICGLRQCSDLDRTNHYERIHNSAEAGAVYLNTWEIRRCSRKESFHTWILGRFQMPQHPSQLRQGCYSFCSLPTIHPIETFPQSPITVLVALLRILLIFNLVTFHQEAPRVTCSSSQNVAPATPILSRVAGTCRRYAVVDMTLPVT